MAENRNDRKYIRQEEAKERQKKRDKRSPKEQLNRLDNLLGKEVGAVKERSRLQAAIELAYKKDNKKTQK